MGAEVLQIEANSLEDCSLAFELYADMVYRLAFARTGSRHDADDVLQETFFRLMRRKPAFYDEEHRKAWLLRVAVNCANTLLRRSHNIVPLTDGQTAEMKEKSEVYDAVMALPANYRTVIHLFYYEKYRVLEIAEIMEIPESTVKTWLRRAREQLREKLKGEYPDV